MIPRDLKPRVTACRNARVSVASVWQRMILERLVRLTGCPYQRARMQLTVIFAARVACGVDDSMLRTNVGPIRLSKPAVLASGILGISLEVFERLHDSGAGAVVTKSLSTEPWEGYPNPTVVGLGSCVGCDDAGKGDAGGRGGGDADAAATVSGTRRSTGWINAVGLSNPGARNFARMIRKSHDVPIMVSLVGSTASEFEHMVSEFEGCDVAAYELNMSCPHVAKVGLEVGDDPQLVSEITRATKRAARSTPVVVKVGLGSSNYLDTVGAAVHAGADAITAINTIRAIAISAELQTPILSNKFGGLSGAPIKPVALRCVYEITSKYDVPIMGCGGVSTWEDAVEFILAGASAVPIGSALGNDNFGLFDEINRGIASYMGRKGVSSIGEMVGLAQ